MSSATYVSRQIVLTRIAHMKTIGIMILSAGVLAVLLGLRNTVEWQAEAKSREAAGGLGVISTLADASGHDTAGNVLGDFSSAATEHYQELHQQRMCVVVASLMVGGILMLSGFGVLIVGLARKPVQSIPTTQEAPPVIKCQAPPPLSTA
jgi:hypothetical protein